MSKEFKNDSEVLAIEQASGTLKETGTEITIQNEEERLIANDTLALIKKHQKALEEKRVFYVKPHNDFVGAINQKAKDIKAVLNETYKLVDGKLDDYETALEKEKERLEKLAQKRIDNAKEKGKPLPVIATPHVEETVKSDMGTRTKRDNWKAEITDSQKALDFLIKNNKTEYLMIDTSMLNQLAKNKKDSVQIPGVRFYNDRTSVMRTK